MEISSTARGEWSPVEPLQKQPDPVKVKFMFRTPGRIPADDHHETCTKMLIVA